MVVGEAPGKLEDQLGRPFVGPSGDLVDEMLEIAGVHRSECWITNVVKYRPPENKLRRLPEIGVDLDEQISKLWDEIRQIKPNCILALGGTALKATTGYPKIKNYRGSILESKDGYPKVVATFHPANLLHQAGGEMADYSAKTYMQFDFNRAVEQSRFREFRRPARNLWVCRDSLSLWRFIERYKDSELLAVDVETSRCVPWCIGIACSRHEGISIPILDLKTHQNPNGIPASELVEIWKLTDKLLRTKKVIGHNLKFDEPKLRMLGFVINFYDDTQLRAHAIQPELPKALAFLTSILTEEPYYKDEREDFDPKKHDIKRMLLYNAKDAAVTFEVFEEQEQLLVGLKVKDFHMNLNRRLHRFYSDIEQEGILVDMAKRKELYVKYTNWIDSLGRELADLTGLEVNCNSPKQVANLLYTHLKLPPRTERDRDTGLYKLKTDEDAIVSLYSNNAKDDHTKRVLKTVLETRQVSKSRSTYISAEPDFDGRIRTAYKITGTETGRTSTGILQAPLRPIKMGMAFQTITKHGDIGADIREELIPDPGYVFLEVDLSQAEDRVVALFGNDYAAFEMWKKGMDRHKITAAQIFKITIEEVTKNHRHIGKRVRHAGNYNMQKRRLMQVVTGDAFHLGIDIQVSEWKAGQLLDEFHRNNPNIRQVFHKEVREALIGRTLVNPFGRVRTFLGRWDDELYKEAFAHLPQSTVSDQLKFAGVRIKDRLQGLRICMEGHDSLTSLVLVNDVKEVAKVMQEELESPIDFSRCSISRGSLVIPCEFKIGEKNLKEMTDYVVH